MNIRIALAIMFAACAAIAASAWDNHAALSRLSLAGETYVEESVAAEPLDAFLEATKGPLIGFLAAFEAEARAGITGYPPLPEGLAFAGEMSGKALKTAFLHAIRINPNLPLPLFLQPAAGAPKDGRPFLPIGEVDLIGNRQPGGPFLSLRPGEAVPVLDLVASASDEPDYGLDVGLYEDNGTDYGKLYGFGIQPFGNPRVNFGTQAPFHMAFASEDPLIKLAASFTQRSNAEYRIELFSRLSRFAFAEGHPYWGWRFGGWALHYVQDLAQPYHSSLLPGMTTFGIIWLNITGSAADKDAVVTILSDRHFILEDYLYRALSAGEAKEGASPLFAALLASRPKAGQRPTAAFRSYYGYDLVGSAAYARGRAMDRLVGASFPAEYVSNPRLEYGTVIDLYDPYASLGKESPAKAAALGAAIAPILADLGSYSRVLISYLRDQKAAELPRLRHLDLRGTEYVAILLVLIAAGAFAIGMGARKRKAARGKV